MMLRNWDAGAARSGRRRTASPTGRPASAFSRKDGVQHPRLRGRYLLPASVELVGRWRDELRGKVACRGGRQRRAAAAAAACVCVRARSRARKCVC